MDFRSGSDESSTRFELLALYAAAECLPVVSSEALWAEDCRSVYCDLPSEQYELSEIQAQHFEWWDWRYVSV